jgi:hypothetical protein
MPSNHAQQRTTANRRGCHRRALCRCRRAWVGCFRALASIMPSGYVSPMTQAVAHILNEFEHLSDSERRELRRAIIERVPMSGDLTDDDFAVLAASSFRTLDEEEDAGSA